MLFRGPSDCVDLIVCALEVAVKGIEPVMVIGGPDVGVAVNM